jgi:hypothetical protein
MSRLLNPFGIPISVDRSEDVRLVSRHLRGRVSFHPQEGGADAALDGPLAQALQAVGGHVADRTQIRSDLLAPRIDHAADALFALSTPLVNSFVERKGAAHNSSLQVHRRRPPEGMRQALLCRDKSSQLLQWARPVGSSPTGHIVYEINVPTPGALATATLFADRQNRAGISALDGLLDQMRLPNPVRNLDLFLLRFPILRDGVKLFEQGVIHPYGLWRYTPDTYQPSLLNVLQRPLDRGFWNGGQRALGLIHGFIDRVTLAFGSELRGRFPRSFVEALCTTYQQQTFAFDHPTIFASPEENADWFVTQLPSAPNKVTLDLVCHSRGGLVARALGAAPRRLALEAKNITLGRIIFVGTPNAGTKLTGVSDIEAKARDALLTVFTNLFQATGGPGTKDAIALIMHIAGLPLEEITEEIGVQAMRPDGPFLTTMNAIPLPPGDQAHFAITADYGPTNGPFDHVLARVKPLVDDIMAGSNDLVVPTEGVMGVSTPQGRFYITNGPPKRFIPSDGVHHLSYFGQKQTQQLIETWLGATPQPHADDAGLVGRHQFD